MREGFVVASMGRNFSIASKSPVSATTEVAQTALPGKVYPVNVVNQLSIAPDEITAYMLKREGESVVRDEPIAENLRPEERERYVYPQVRVIQPGGPYFRMPWERIHKVSIATVTVNIGNSQTTIPSPAANRW